ncbi:hypothetical protein [Streptomyces sp. NRRL S-237]|uniref:hypothetical protein n=1 Tax=Streptomyces sp. NRRL S-237 TaxID=1463895 RepID=UPI0004C5CE5A|nr:hypothetical protein [Streptomyces sp. NRRL S-237]
MSQTPSSPELSYPAVRNGLDFLRSVVEHLDGPDPDARAVKFAVVHLQAATEILLKAALASLDWQLVFADPDKVDEAAYKAGDFVSIGSGKAITLLKREGVEIANREKKEIERLALERNKLAHFGGTLSAAAVEARSGVVLEFLLRFIDDHIRTELDEHLAEEMRFVREGVPRIRGYVTARMARVEAELASLKHSTLTCPSCGMWALVADGGQLDCLVCVRSWDPETFPLEYAVYVLGHSWRDYRKTGQPANYCPECRASTLVDEAYLADAPEQQRAFCFSCSQAFDDLDNCTRCALPFQPRDNEDLTCGDCWSAALARD